MAKAEQKSKQRIKEEENKRRNEQREEPVTPRAKAKAKSGPSPNRPSPKASPMKLKPVPIFPDGGEKASGSTNNPESGHEPKGPSGRPSNTQPTNQVPPVKKTTTKQESPKHDTDWDHSKSKAHWNKKNKGYVADQLYQRNCKWPRHPNGKIQKLRLPDSKRTLMDTIPINLLFLRCFIYFSL